MPWSAPKVYNVDNGTPHTLCPNNLSSDGDGRIAFIQASDIRCVKRLSQSVKPPTSKLAYSEKINITSVYWWRGLDRLKHPLLVFTTVSDESQHATVQIWNAWRGRGSRLRRFELSTLDAGPGLQVGTSSRCEKSIDFGRGIAQASSSPNGQVLFCGASNGAVYGIVYTDGSDGLFQHVCTLRDVNHPIVALSGDKHASDFLAASDENGGLTVWRLTEELDRDGSNPERYRCNIIYRRTLQDDYICALGVLGDVAVAGHSTGCVSFYNLEDGFLMARVICNTKPVMGVDIYRKNGLVLICGEDCRITVLGFSKIRDYRPVVHFSCVLQSMITGCCFVDARLGLPKIAVLTWQKTDIVLFEYHKKRSRTDQESPDIIYNDSSHTDAQDQRVIRASLVP